MATIEAIATQRNNENGRPEKYRFRNESDIYTHTRYVMKGNDKGRPFCSSARGFINSNDDPEVIADEMVAVQELHKKTTGLRIRGEIATVGKGELDKYKGVEEIKEIAWGLGDYYMGRGHQVAYGIYDRGGSFEILFAINPTNYADGSKYRHNNNSLQDEEEKCLATIIADVTGRTIPEEKRFDFEQLEYHF